MNSVKAPSNCTTGPCKTKSNVHPMALKLPTLVIEPEGTLKKVPSNTDSRVSFFLPDELPPEPTSSASLAPPQHYGSSRGSIFESTSRLKKRASHIILEVPVAQLKKINETEGVGSIKRESKHFCDNTTLHGPKRVYYGKKFSFVFWIVMLMVSLVLLTLQVVTLISMYVSHPTVSQVSFLIKDDGIEFPLVTLCNFNPIKKSYIRHINKTHDFSDDLLDYLMEFLIDANTLYGTADRANLHVGEKALESYLMTHPNFTVQEFFMDAGFECEESMMLCSFGGRQFSCCQYMTAMLTNLGKCYTLDLQSSGKDWMEKQMEAGVTAGLQIITDVHLEEQFDGTGDDADPIFSDDFENGYRYYVHAPATVPDLNEQSERWGNCTSKWPHDFDSQLPYSAVNCDSICKAKFFNAKCGCSPFTYDIEKSFSLCTPFQTVRCIDDYIRKTVNGVAYYDIPRCSECQVECDSVVYHAYNSYGHGFSNGALKWLSKKNSSWSIPHMKANFLTINVFFRDMSYTEYMQVQGTTLTETLSDIGGNMGLFLGMSVITVIEVVMYFSKIGWITISKKRRNYMYQKKANEKEHEKQLEETVNGFRLFRSRKYANDMSHTRARIRALTDKVSSENDAESKSTSERESDATDRRSRFFNENTESYYSDNPERNRNSVVELKINLRDLEHVNNGYMQVNSCANIRTPYTFFYSGKKKLVYSRKAIFKHFTITATLERTNDSERNSLKSVSGPSLPWSDNLVKLEKMSIEKVTKEQEQILIRSNIPPNMWPYVNITAVVERWERKRNATDGGVILDEDVNDDFDDDNDDPSLNKMHNDDQAVSGLMAAFATNKLKNVGEAEELAHKQCNKDAMNVKQHAICVVRLLQAEEKYQQWLKKLEKKAGEDGKIRLPKENLNVIGQSRLQRLNRLETLLRSFGAKNREISRQRLRNSSLGVEKLINGRYSTANSWVGGFRMRAKRSISSRQLLKVKPVTKDRYDLANGI
ncbi:hypothetical protein RB195_005830 [Necator americanus]|uniref:Amiloride-sensitive sodium channel n=1 Tax=Necator americanus TaxID=51031 RepID=A0ABR1BPV7_NECAM